MPNARSGREIAFEAPDKVGLLNEISTELANAGVNVVTICAYSMEGKASFMMITSDNAKAMEVLKGKGYDVKDYEVVLYDLENKVGAMAEMTKKLADAGVNMEYFYGTTGAPEAPALLVFKSSNNAKAVEVLNA
jgi:hypothetical protein